MDEGIRAQIFDSKCTRLGPEFQVNSDPRPSPVYFAPVISVALDNNNFAIVWHAGNRRTWEPFLQIFHPDASKVGSETGLSVESVGGSMISFINHHPELYPAAHDWKGW
jgi:hypothetical protein